MYRKIALALAAVALAGCGSPTSTPVTLEESEEVFIYAIRNSNGDWSGASDDDLIRLGYDTCEKLEETTVAELTDSFTSAIADGADITPEQVGSLMGASIAALCPHLA